MKKCPKCNRKFDSKLNLCPFDNIPLIEIVEKDNMGEVLNNKYRIVAQIGEGGMGKVYNKDLEVLTNADIPQVDIDPEKVQEVRSQYFADSSSVWFDPYTKPEEKKDKMSEDNNAQLKVKENQESIIIDTGAKEEIELEDIREEKKSSNDKIESLELATTIPKQTTSKPKVHTPLKTKEPHREFAQGPSIKSARFDRFLNRKNILIGISGILLISIFVAFLIYKSFTSGLDKELQMEIKYNTPVAINPSAVNQEEVNKDKEENEIEDADRQTKETAKEPKKVKIKSTKQTQLKTERPQEILQSPKDYFKQANNYFKQGKYDLAAEYYKSAIRLQPDFAMAYRGLGACYAMMGKADLAIKQYEKYVELDPNGPDVEKVIKIINEYRNKNK